MPDVLVESRGHVRLITINRPQRMNAIGPDAAQGLREALGNFRDDGDARVAVLTGAGGDAFCAGADLGSAAAMFMDDPPGGAEPLFDPARPASETGAREGMIGPSRWTDIHKPIIAAVNGVAYAGGLEWACFAHIRIADEHASFGVTCRRWNVGLGDGGTQRLPRIVGMGHAMEMIITGRVIGAREAAAIGLVNEITPSGSCRERALELAETVSELPQEAMRTDMEAAARGFGEPLERGLEIEAERFNTLLGDPAMGEGVMRFLDRDHPDRRIGAAPLHRPAAAYAMAARAHREQAGKGGKGRYIDHVARVASLVAPHAGETAVSAAYLHDTLEKTDLDADRIEATLGPEVLRIVESMSEDPAIEPYARRKRDLRRKALESGPEARLIYAADKLDGIDRITSLIDSSGAEAIDSIKSGPDLRLALWREDLEALAEAGPELPLLAPLASRLGELEKAIGELDVE